MCEFSEGRQPTALARGEGEGGEEVSTRPAVETILRRPVTLATWRIYNIVTLRPKYTLGVQTFHVLKTVQECKNSLKTVTFLKRVVIFEFLTLKLVLKSF